MSSDRLLPHNQFLQALNGCPTYLTDLDSTGGASAELDLRPVNGGEAVLLLLCCMTGDASFELFATTGEDSGNTGVHLVTGEKIYVTTTKDKPFLVVNSGTVDCRVRVHRLV